MNRIKPNEELLNKIVNSFLEKNKNNINELKEVSNDNEYSDYLNFFKEKFDELENEKRISLQNTLINKFQNEFRNFNQSKNNF